MSDSPRYGKLHSLMEGYLDYLRDVKRLAVATIRDVRSTLRRTDAILSARVPETPLWKRKLTDFVYWVEVLRQRG